MQPQDEWLLTDGLGGFAMGTRDGVPRRRYHGLCIASMAPPLRRRTILRAAMAEVVASGESTPLWQATFVPHGVLAPPMHVPNHTTHEPNSVRTEWTSKTVELVRTLTMKRGVPGVVLRWRGFVPPHATLRVHLLAPLVDFHAFDRGQESPQSELITNGVLLKRGEVQARFEINGGSFVASPDHWHGLRFAEEHTRGYDAEENCFTPGHVDAVADDQGRVDVTINVLPQVPQWPVPPVADSDIPLAQAAADFLVARGHPQGPSVIAGWPWFADWGRDTLLSIPGLLLVDGRMDEAEAMLETWGATVSDGRIPNRFLDEDEGRDLGSADAALWYLHVVGLWLEAANQPFAHGPIATACRSIVEAWLDGASPGTQIDSDGLVVAEEPGRALTWMDAVVDGIPITPRMGKPVELSALWCHSLRVLAERAADDAEGGRLRRIAERTAGSFGAFYCDQTGGLVDRLRSAREGGGVDRAIRPNMVIAAALRAAPLDRARRQRVVDLCRTHLLTPYGLRTLAPSDPDYQGRYEGTMPHRDRAYHQGTAWPWLLGFLVEAHLRSSEHDPASRTTASTWLQPLAAELNSAGLGQLSEVYDGDLPHRPNGCPAQAWSVSEWRRATAMVERGPKWWMSSQVAATLN